MSLSIGGPNGVSISSRFRDNCALSVLGPWVRHFKVTWRHRSRDHLIAYICHWHMAYQNGGSLCQVCGLGLNMGLIGGPLEPSIALTLTVSEIFKEPTSNVAQLVDMTFIWPLNKGQGHLFWYQSISHIRLPVLSIVTFALGRTIYSVQTDRQTDDRRQRDASLWHIARPYVRSVKMHKKKKLKHAATETYRMSTIYWQNAGLY